MNDYLKILFVDDNLAYIELIKELLKGFPQFDILYETDLNSTLEILSKEKFNCILLDLNLPDSMGIDTLKGVVSRFPELAIVILTVLDDESSIVDALRNGAQDYLVKGRVNGEIISRSIRYAIERKKSENALRESEKKYRDITETILEGLWITDSEGNTTHINIQLAEMLGYSKAEILNVPFFNFVNEKFRDKSREYFERRKKGIKDRYDFCFDKKDGSELWVIVSASPTFDEKGKFAGTMGLLTDISDHKLIEQSLEKSVNEWYSTFNAIKDAICITDAEGRTLRHNKAASKLFSALKMGDEKECFEFMKCSIDRLEECPIYRVQKTLVRETKTIQVGDKWYYCTVDPLTDNGNIIGSVHIMSDITKYKLIQDQFREGEERWRMLTENSAEYITITDLEGIIEFTNRGINFPKEKIIGTSIYKYIPDKFKQTVIDCIERVRDSRNPESYYSEYEKNDGTILYFISNVAPIVRTFEKTKRKDVVGLIISSSDITERKKIEDALRESEERYRTIIEHSNDMIWTLDIDGNFTFFNRRAEKTSGYKLEDWKGKNFAPLIVKEDLQKVIDVFRTTLSGQPQEYETTFINKFNKRITLSVNTAPVYSKGRVIGTVSFGRDITQQKFAEKKVKKTGEELERSNKELEQFAYIASHDLQEPLRSISSFTELLRRRYKSKIDPDADEFIGYIIDGSKRMQEMINDLLALSRVETRGKEFQTTNVNKVLEDVFKNLHSMIQRNNAIITIDEMPIINADASQLSQLFQNLIDNAIKFRKPEFVPQIHISAKKENREWIFSVKDNGIGIDPKNFNKLFVIFQRLHSREEYPGTGIGLALCKKIVARHGGRIWVESKLGEGSTFYFSIPFKRGENGFNDS